MVGPCPLLAPVKELLHTGDPAAARKELLRLLYSTEALRVWHRALRVPDPRSAIRILSFVRDIEFGETDTAHVNLDTGVVCLGSAFVQERLSSFEDLIFVILHERGHVLFHALFGSRLAQFANFDFANLWEDIYINNSVLLVMESSLPSSFYATSSDFFRLLLVQEPQRWFRQREPWCRFHLPPWIFDAISELEKDPFFVRRISYPTWMDIGSAFEEKLLGTDALPEVPPPLFLSQSYDEDVLVPQPDEESVSALGLSGDEIRGVSAPSLPNPSSGVRTALETFSLSQQPVGLDMIMTALHIQDRIKEFLQTELVGSLVAERHNDAFIEGSSLTPSSISSKDAFYLAAGMPPLYWTENIPLAREKLKFYIDVSGSMSIFWSFVAGIARHFGEHCDAYFQFSTDIVPVDAEEHRIFSTQGTDYNIVAEHILHNDFTQVIVLTDNTASLNAQLLQQLKDRLHLLCLLQTREDPNPKGFDVIATKTFTISDLDLL